MQYWIHQTAGTCVASVDEVTGCSRLQSLLSVDVITVCYHILQSQPSDKHPLHPHCVTPQASDRYTRPPPAVHTRTACTVQRALCRPRVWSVHSTYIGTPYKRPVSSCSLTVQTNTMTRLVLTTLHAGESKPDLAAQTELYATRQLQILSACLQHDYEIRGSKVLNFISAIAHICSSLFLQLTS